MLPAPFFAPNRTAETVALTLHTQFGGSSNKFSIRVLNPDLQTVEPSFGPRDSQNLITISVRITAWVVSSCGVACGLEYGGWVSE